MATIDKDKNLLENLNSLSKMQTGFLFFMTTLKEYIEENKNIKSYLINIKSKFKTSEREIIELEKNIKKLHHELEERKTESKINSDNTEVLLEHIRSVRSELEQIRKLFADLSNISKIEGINLEEHVIQAISIFDKYYKTPFRIEVSKGSRKNIKRRKPKSKKPKSKKPKSRKPKTRKPKSKKPKSKKR